MAKPAPPPEAKQERKIDRAAEDSFPASDPPSTTPIVGTRRAETADQAAQRDPHGIGPAEEAAKEEPKGRPTSDRHKMQTVAGKTKP